MRSVLGLLFAALLLYAAFGWDTGAKDDRLEKLRESGQTVTGEVSELREVERTRRTGGRRSKRREQYTENCPRITFHLDGAKHEFVEYDDCDRLGVGDEVTVLVDPTEPYNARLDSDQVRDRAESNSRTTWWLAGAGVVFGIGSLIGLATRISRFRARGSALRQID